MTVRMTSAVAVALALTLPALAQDNVVIDYNDGALDMADPAQWSPIAEKIGGDIEVLGEVSGAFTEGVADEVAYLVSNGAPVAADPFPEVSQRLVVFAGEEQVADWALPGDSAYSRAVTAADMDGDGISEVILEGSFYNMGTLALGLSAIRVGETPEVIQTLPEVFVDSCEAGVGDKSISTSIVSIVDGQMVAETTDQPCP